MYPCGGVEDGLANDVLYLQGTEIYRPIIHRNVFNNFYIIFLFSSLYYICNQHVLNVLTLTLCLFTP